MLRKILLAVIFILFSCDKKVEKNHVRISLTENQSKIVKLFNITKKLRNTDPFKIKNYADNISTLAKNEPNDMKALGAIAYGNYYLAINNDSLSFKNFNAALNFVKATKTDTLMFQSLAGIGNYHKNTGNYQKAISSFLTALKIAEKLNDQKDRATIHAYLGQVYLQKDDQKNAQNNLLIAKDLLSDRKEERIYLIAIHTLANFYGMNGNYKEALKLDEEGLNICKKIRSNDLKATFLDNKANCFMYSKKLDSANHYFNECLKLDIIAKNPKQISDSYANFAQLAIFYDHPEDVIDYAEKSIKIAKSVNYNSGIGKNYKLLTDLYNEKGDYKKAFEFSQKYQANYKSLINEKNEIAIAELKTIYESDKKDKELLLSKTKIAETQAEIERKKVQFLILILISLGLITVAYLIYKQQKLKIKQQAQEFQLRSAIEKIDAQNQLHEQRLSISRDLHDNIGAQLTFIISSVDNLKYGGKIADEKVNTQLNKINNFTRSTIIELRDTIWAMNSDEISLEDLQVRMLQFIEKAEECKDYIKINFEIEPDLKTEKFSSLEGINLYRTMQEAINNSLKYAEATEIKITAIEENQKILLCVKDNGKGFDLQNAELGNGLLNMRKRIEEIGGNFNIESSNGGTEICINLKSTK